MANLLAGRDGRARETVERDVEVARESERPKVSEVVRGLHRLHYERVNVITMMFGYTAKSTENLEKIRESQNETPQVFFSSLELTP